MEKIKLGQKVSFKKVLVKRYKESSDGCNSKGMNKYLKGLKLEETRKGQLSIWLKRDTQLTQGIVIGIRYKQEGLVETSYDYGGGNFIHKGTIKTVLIAYDLSKNPAVVKYEDVIV